jgi:simple sugar transport system substrate-binding protein
MNQSFKKYIILVIMLPFIIVPLLLASIKGKSTETPRSHGASSSPVASNSPVASSSPRSNLHFIVITHGQLSNPFWAVFKKGVDQAAKDLGVHVQYEFPVTFDLVAMAHLIDAAVASKPNGLVVTIPNANALGPSIQRAIAAGIPVISANSGSDVAKQLGVLVHVGQSEYNAGLGAGQKMATTGVKHVLCINQQVGNAALDERCKGFTDAMTQVGAKVEVLAINQVDPNGTRERIQAALLADPTIDGIMALGPVAAIPALNALQNLNKVGQIKLATFDLSPAVLQAIKSGTILFAVDQQQYLQGYLPIVLLTLYGTNLNTIANDVLMTGPGFVTQDNVSRVISLSQQGTR